LGLIHCPAYFAFKRLAIYFAAFINCYAFFLLEISSLNFSSYVLRDSICSTAKSFKAIYGKVNES